MKSYRPYTIRFPNGLQALAVLSEETPDIPALVKALELPSQPRGLLVLSGGAGLMDEESSARMHSFFQTLAGIVKSRQLMVIDGGTSAGIMALVGEALSEEGRSAIHIGVVPAKAEVDSEGKIAEDILEPHHTHFVLVETNEWGREVTAMYGLVEYFSKNTPSAILLINGGGLSLQEIQHGVRQGHIIVIFAGSGRLADEIARAINHPEALARSEIRELIQEGRFIIFDTSKSPRELQKLLLK
jgi:hypothetical protein